MCCCPPCQTNPGGNQHSRVCCKCIPKRICLTIYSPDGSYCFSCGDDETGHTLSTLRLDCENRLGVYAGSFRCADEGIDFRFYFERDADGKCWFMLESTKLGYVSTQFDTYISDTRLRQPMGGDDHDDVERMREQCVAPDFEFLIDLSSIFDTCGHAVVTVGTADFISPKCQNRNWRTPPDCWCQCVRLKLTLDGVETLQAVCWDDERACWHATFLGAYPEDDIEVAVFVSSESGAQTLLRMESTIGDGDPIEAICSSNLGMFAEWDLYGDAVTIMCDKAVGCTDCKCWCRCVCIIYSDSRNADVVRACLDEYSGGWRGEFAFEGGEVITVEAWLACNAETKVTEMHISTNLGDAAPTAVICPDVAASWTFIKENYDTALVTIQCDNCTECRNLVRIPCCPTPMPLVLYATVTGYQSCLQDVLDPPVIRSCGDGAFPLAFTPNLPAGPALWQGQGGHLSCPEWGYLGCDGLAGVFLQIGCSTDESVGVLNLFQYCPPGSSPQIGGGLVTGSMEIAPGSTCHPVHIVITGLSYIGIDPTCSDGGPFYITIEITE